MVPTYLTFLVVLVPTGLVMLTFTTAANSSTQLNTAPEMRGRVMGLYMLVFLGGTPIGSPLAGWVAEAGGARMSIIAGGLISLVATVVMTYVLARNGGIRIPGYARSAELAHSTT